jgi:RNA polymerase sigma-70 factor (ECF subfamily)
LQQGLKKKQDCCIFFKDHALGRQSALEVNQYHKSEAELKSELQEISAAKSDPARFNVLYDRYYKPVFIFIYRRVGDEEISADICSLVFLKALINIRKFEFKGVPFSAWLFRIAFNEINMYFRKNKRERIVSLDAAGLQNISSEMEEGEDLAAQQEVMKVLKMLPDEDIQLIELRFFEKRSFADIGGIVGITENNAKVKVYRIFDKMKKLLKRKPNN